MCAGETRESLGATRSPLISLLTLRQHRIPNTKQIYPRRVFRDQAERPVNNMPTKQPIFNNVSSGVVDLLAKRGMTLTAIAKMLGLSTSYISRVRAGARSFTLDHLTRIEREIGESLPSLLLEATPLSSVPPHLRPLYRATRTILKKSAYKTSNARRAA